MGYITFGITPFHVLHSLKVQESSGKSLVITLGHYIYYSKKPS